ncbi:MAG TPA: M23 family metallopeptidase [Candidatus Paceibacterota bacterium]|nr:M23 family metallopeptidase [Candidatus Paceibacterota bacterium]
MHLRRFLIPILLPTLLIVSIGAIHLYRTEVRTEVDRFIETVSFPFKLARLLAEPAPPEILMPVEGARVRSVADTWGGARPDGRSHEGQDIFAARGTPIRPAARGYIVRVGENTLGGKVVFILGSGARGYYYAHLDGFGPAATIGSFVETEDVIGYVGNTGNAERTSPHLHFGVYQDGEPVNPLPLLIDRSPP